MKKVGPTLCLNPKVKRVSFSVNQAHSVSSWEVGDVYLANVLLVLFLVRDTFDFNVSFPLLPSKPTLKKRIF